MSAPREYPILFSGPMVRALLDGTKTQTRRVVKPQPNAGPNGQMVDLGGGFGLLDGDLSGEWRCPYGQPGSLLWVRETWQDVHPTQIAEGRYSQKGEAGIPGPPPVSYRTIYRADGLYPRLHFQQAYPYRHACVGPGCARCARGAREVLHPEETYTGWRPSIHMPRWASRITLELTDVRVQRVQEISREDAESEGFERTPGLPIDPRDWFRNLWESINAKRGYGWDANPWVWALTFRRITP